VVRVPTNRPVIRSMGPPRVFATEERKFEAIADEALRLRDAVGRC